MEWNAHAHISCNASAHANLTPMVLQRPTYCLEDFFMEEEQVFFL
jgi:hypothetical protein